MNPTDATRQPPPEPAEGTSPDPRWRMINRTMRLHEYRPRALIETLHAVQEAFGFLDREHLRVVAEALQVPLSRVYAVATFYHFFTLRPPGEHTCVVCTGTACYIGGAPALLAAIRRDLGICPGQTTGDKRFSLLTAHCLGACGLAPAAVFDKVVAGRLVPDEVVARLKGWVRDDTDA